jgi:hypothetical protein
MRARAAAIILLALVARGALAHDTWIAPRKVRVDAAQPMVLDVTSGGAFPALDFAIRPERVARAAVRLGGRITPIEEKQRLLHSLRMSVKPSGNGIAAILLTLPPKELEVETEKVSHYLDEIGADAGLRRQWDSMPAPKKWIETYTKAAKTFVAVGDAGSDESWKEPVGLPLEIVPLTHPLESRAGTTFTVRVLKAGKPFVGFALAAVGAGGKRTLRRTNEDGIVSFTCDRPGRWLFSGTDLRPVGARWESDFTTLTVDVRPARL